MSGQGAASDGADRGGAWRAAGGGAAAALGAGVFIAPFGVLSGVIAAETGLTLLQTMALSILVFAGASQLAALELMRAGAPWAVIVISGLAVNLRFLLYSASLAPHFASLSRGAKALAAYFTVDNGVSALLSWRGLAAATAHERFAYFVACGATSWIIWQSATVIGHELGPVFDARALKLVAPVAFIALAAPLLTSRPRWAAALVAAALAVVLKGRVESFDIVLAAAAGVAVGLAFPAPEREATDR